ncbi:MAG TPA: uracil-DNA glycosylase [Anaeromyxobacteraceae bacterium]|nr:uracil-DNA glycosylase [Anaeromyxobacteraceae bacterium]
MSQDEELGELVEETRRHLVWLRDAGFREVPPPPAAGTPRRASPAAAPAPAQAGSPSPEAPEAPEGAVAAPAGEALPWGLGDKGCGSDALLGVRRELGECARCKLSGGRTHLVFGVGDPRAELMFVGEGPGADEDRQGEPFVGKAGQLLTKMIEAMGLRREEVYIANVVKCRPPENRNPEPDEIQACEPFLRAQIAAIRPRVIVALGKFAAQTLLRDPTPITRLRGGWREYEGVRLMPTFHPAYLLRSPAEKGKAWEDLKAVVRELGRTLPQR